MHEIDATNKTLGRIATEAAVLLRGKNSPAYQRHLAPKNKVLIKNASKLKVTGNKMDGKVYLRHSGYPSGQKSTTLAELITKKGYGEALRNAIYGMLPDNRLRNVAMKNLTITD